MTTNAGNVATWVILKCAVTQNRVKDEILVAVSTPKPIRSKTFSRLRAVLFKVHPQLCNNIESIVGPHHERCKGEVGSKGSKVIPRDKRPAASCTSDDIFQTGRRNSSDNRRFTRGSWGDSGTETRRWKLQAKN